MAPSPELGQPKPKAPDKVDTKQCSADGTANNSVDIQKSANATQQDTENLGSWEDTELKKLLDEAFTYKRPKDREHKSEIFRELLQNVEQEDKLHHNYVSNRFLGRSVRGSNRHTQGGSLQDLAETDKQDQLLESDGIIGSHSRRQHNSRQKKYSSVSTRQREGGSLPSNVNCNPYEDHFSNDFGKRGIKNEKAILMSGGTTRQDGFNRGEDSQQEGKAGHTVIEMGDGEVDETCHLLAHDSLARDPQSSDEGTEMSTMKRLPRLGVNYTGHHYLDLEMMNEASRIDKTVQFNSLKSGNKPSDVNIQLNKSYVAVNSCIDSNSMSGLPLVPGQNPKFATYHHPHNIHLIEQKNTDENGNALQTFNSTLPSGQLAKKDGKKKKTERNIKSTIAAKDIEGNRGDDNIEDLVSFIENDDTHKNGVMNNNVSKRMLQLDKKGKKGGTDNKKENSGNNKLKKYNSMENLKSTSKLEEENSQSENGRESAVVLRHKQQMKKAAEVKENKQQQQQHQKRGERRSWGTEELTYLGDTNAIVKETTVRDNDAKEIRKAKDHQKANKKKDEQPESLVSSESILALNEAAGFHVVTKKKKPKKKQEEIRQKPLYHGQHAQMQGNRFRQSSQNYSTDREPYLTPLNLKFKRRKSTSSSMPPSEKSDSSDVDSLTTLLLHPYAEIARISQQSKQGVLATSLDKWPTVSNGKNPESPDNSNVSTCSTLSAKSQGSVRGNKFFPDATDTTLEYVSSNNSNSAAANATKAISYSQSLTEDKQHKIADPVNMHEEMIKRSSNSLSVMTNNADAIVKCASDINQKNPLQKSKSVDNDNYVNMNIDQYPALEKTVKPQKQYQSMPAVQINNVNANPTNVAISSTKTSSKSTKLSSQSQSIPVVVKSIESCTTTNPSKKPKSTTSPNAVHQSASRDKCHLEAQPEFVFHQNEDNLKTKPSVELCDVSFCATYPPQPLHTSSTTKKSVKREKSSQLNATQNHLNFDRNRPAVIILDNNNKYGHNVSPLLFGDFEEDEVRQWDQDSEPPFIMLTNQHQTQPSHIPSVQSNPTEVGVATTGANDKLLSPQSDLGYSSSYSRNTTELGCEYTTNTGSVEQTLDVASDQMQSNVRRSSSCSNSAGLDQVNNNTEPSVDSSSVSPINKSDVVAVTLSSRDKMTIVCEGDLKLLYIKPTVSNLDNYNHARIVDFIGLAWEDIKYGSAEFYNGQ
ncbi:hypothetical protein HA402_010751 [Bradysia odoriphaga]|nr:hypothetical protein HA402_010751 [Bradysia odoriphaga]